MIHRYKYSIHGASGRTVAPTDLSETTGPFRLSSPQKSSSLGGFLWGPSAPRIAMIRPWDSRNPFCLKLENWPMFVFCSFFFVALPMVFMNRGCFFQIDKEINIKSFLVQHF